MTQVLTTVLAPAASYDLTDLATVKDELAIDPTNEGDDTWLGRAISQVSRAIANATNRVFPPEFLQDVFDLQRVRNDYQVNAFGPLQLSRWPILDVASVVQTAGLGLTQTLVAGVDFQVDAINGRLLRLSSDTGLLKPWETMPVTVSYLAGYGGAVQEQHSVPASGPFTVTVSQAAEFSCDQSVSYASGALLQAVASSPAKGQYSVDSATGVYTFNAGDEGAALTFAYGVANVPDDIEEACLRLVTSRFRAKGRDPALVQRDTPSVGVERFWFGGAPGQRGAFPPDVEALLDNYHVPVVA